MSAQPFYYRSEDYHGSTIKIEVERETGDTTTPAGIPVVLHTVRGYIDEVLSTGDEQNPTDAIAPYPSITDKISTIIDSLKAQIDAADRLDLVLTGMDFEGGSDAVTGFVLIPGAAASGEITVDWDTDADFDYIEIYKAELADLSDEYLLVSGALTDPYLLTGTPGTDYYIRMRGQRSGSDWGPFTPVLMETAP